MTTVTEQLDDFLADAKTRSHLRPNSLRAYRTDLRQMGLALPTALDQITTPAVEAYLASCTAASTRAWRIASLHRFFSWARRVGLCTVDPTEHLEPTRATKRLPRPVRSDADMRVVERGIATAPQPFRLIFTLLRETGMRVGEVLALNVGDVTLEPGREGLHIREAKNRVERIVILGPSATPQSLRGLRTHLKAIGSSQPAHAQRRRGSSHSKDPRSGAAYS